MDTRLAQVVDRFRTMLLSVAARHAIRDHEVDLLIQDVRLRLWRRLEGSESAGVLPTSYVYQAAQSAAIDLLRQRRRQQARFADDGEAALAAVAHTGATDDAVMRNDTAAAVEQALDGLLPPRRIVVRMSLAGYGRAEIAERLGWTEARVRNLLSRGMQDLRSALRMNLGDHDE